MVIYGPLHESGRLASGGDYWSRGLIWEMRVAEMVAWPALTWPDRADVSYKSKHMWKSIMSSQMRTSLRTLGHREPWGDVKLGKLP